MSLSCEVMLPTWDTWNDSWSFQRLFLRDAPGLAGPQGCSCLAPFGLILTQGLFCSQAETEPVAPSAVQNWHRPHCRQGEESNHTAAGTAALLWLSQAASSKISHWVFYTIPLFPTVSFALFWSSFFYGSEHTHFSHIIFTFLLFVSSAAPWDHGVSEGDGVWLLPFRLSAAQPAHSFTPALNSSAQSSCEQLKPCTISGVSSTAELPDSWN